MSKCVEIYIVFYSFFCTVLSIYKKKTVQLSAGSPGHFMSVTLFGRSPGAPAWHLVLGPVLAPGARRKTNKMDSHMELG